MISQLSIFFTTSSGVYFDLRRNPSAPRARALFSSSTHSRFVLTITFVERLVFDLSTLSISNPSIFGIMISRMMMSGFICAALVIPSSPSYAETTVHHSPRNAIVYISLILWLSSMMRTVLGRCVGVSSVKGFLIQAMTSSIPLLAPRKQSPGRHVFSAYHVRTTMRSTDEKSLDIDSISAIESLASSRRMMFGVSHGCSMRCCLVSKYRTSYPFLRSVPRRRGSEDRAKTKVLIKRRVIGFDCMESSQLSLYQYLFESVLG